jgi:hypothetical protein
MKFGFIQMIKNSKVNFKCKGQTALFFKNKGICGISTQKLPIFENPNSPIAKAKTCRKS